MASMKNALAARWATEMEVLERLAAVKTTRETQQSLLERLSGLVRARETELESSLEDLPPDQRLSVISRATASYRRDLKVGSEADRTALLSAATEHARSIAGVANHYGSPVQMLMRESLGSERRSRIHQQIQESGPAELAALAEYAAGTKDLELAAAVCSRNSALKAVDRQFSAQDLAGALLGDRHRKVTDAILEIEAISQEVLNDDRAFSTGRRNPTEKLTLALLRRGEPDDGNDLPAFPPKG